MRSAGLAALLVGAVAVAPPLGVPRVTVVTPGAPFASVGSTDGKYIFVSVSGSKRVGVTTYRASGAEISQVGFVPIAATGAFGMALSPDGTSLLVADGDGVAIVDVAAAEAGTAQIPLQVSDGRGSGAIEVAVTSDSRYAFVSDEERASVSVLRLVRRPGGRFDGVLVNAVRIDQLPVGLAISTGDHFLYVTSEVEGLRESHAGDSNPDLARSACRNGPQGLVVSNGTITTIDVARAEAGTSESVVSRVAAGCAPVRVALTPDGATAWVSVRGDDSVFAFDTQRLHTNPEHAFKGAVAVGSAPVGLALIDGGAFLAVADSDRFGVGAPSTLHVIALSGKPAVVSIVPVGVFPRELSTSADGSTLRLTNFGSSQLMLFDVKRLTQAPL